LPHIGYRCFDCQIHPESLLCEDCFKRGNHDGHRYIQLKDEGNCDCGSKDLIKEEGFCPLHTGAEEIIEIDSSEEFVFNLYVRQLFIWIFKLIKIQQKDGEIILLYFLNYLT
jgi:DNA-directed RNA polymerase subunit RPC12/RpoP